MTAQRPLLSEIVQDSAGNAKSLAVTIREKDGSALAGTLYDTSGNVVSNPQSSNTLGLLELMSNRPRRVQIRPAGAATWTTAAFNTDPENLPLNLDDFASGSAINTGVNSAYTALQAAIVVAQSTGQEIHVGAGTYLLEQLVTIPSGVSIVGVGRASVFKHAAASANPLFFMSDSTTAARLSRCRIDGNRSQNNNDATGFNAGEVYIAGTDNIVEDVEVFNFNSFGMIVSGLRPKFIRCRFVGVALGSYKPTSGVNASRDFGSIYGFFVAATSYCHGLYMEDCYATGMRSAGLYPGGTNFLIIHPVIENCHKGYYPDDGTGIPSINESGGGQLAFVSTWDGVTPLPGGAANTAPQGTVISPRVEQSVGAPAATGIEIGAGAVLTIIDPYVERQQSGGISITGASQVTIRDGLVANALTVGIGIDNATSVTIDGTAIENSATTGLAVTGTTDYLTLRNLEFYANATNESGVSAVAHLQSFGHRVRNGSAVTTRWTSPTPQTGQASGSLAVTATPTDIAGCSVSLGVGYWAVTGTFMVVVADAADLGVNMVGSLVTSGGTATIANSTAQALFKTQAQPVNTPVTRTWYVNVTAATTAKLQGSKAAGVATASVMGITHTTIEAFYMGGPA